MFAPHVIDEEFLFLIYKMFLEIIRKRLLRKMVMDTDRSQKREYR